MTLWRSSGQADRDHILPRLAPFLFALVMPALALPPGPRLTPTVIWVGPRSAIANGLKCVRERLIRAP